MKDELDFRFQRYEHEEEKSMVEINLEKTFTFTEQNIRDILADYLKREHQVTVKPDDFKLNISDSTTGGYMERDFVPAKLRGISVTVKG